MKSHQFIIVVLLFAFSMVSAGYGQQTAEQLYQSALYKEEIEGELDAAIKIYETIIKQYPENRPVAAKALLHSGICKERLGYKEAQKAYEQVVRDYNDQAEPSKMARERLSALGGSGITSGAGGLITRRILTDASDIKGALTKDGKYIRGVDWETGDLVQFEVASGQTSRIKNINKTPGNETEYNLEDEVVSRDGKQIVYNVETLEPNTKKWLYQLRIRNLDGSKISTIYSENIGYIYPLDWSPDSKSILAIRIQDKADDLVQILTTDGSVRIVKANQSRLTGLLFASYSPDGRLIAFSTLCDGNTPHSDIFLIAPDGSNEVVVAGHPADDQFLQWTPDGRSLLFISDRSGTWDLWRIRIAEGKEQGEPELLKKDFGYNVWDVIGLAPNGSLYYRTQTNLGSLNFGVINIETGKVLVPPSPVTTRYTGRSSQPVWSPDGRNLAYISRRGTIGPGNNILTIRSAETGEERFPSPRLRFLNQISWAPDSRSIIALGYGMGNETGTYQIDIETGKITRLADLGLSPKLSPDGKTLWSADGAIIRKRNLETGEESEVVNVGTGGTAQMFYDLSPDGRDIVFQKDSIVKIMSLSGGEPREIFRGPVRNYRLRWSRDGNYIIARADSVIRRIPVQGGTPLKLNLSIPDMESFALHPDNKRFAFCIVEGAKEELWVMENFLPK